MNDMYETAVSATDRLKAMLNKQEEFRSKIKWNLSLKELCR